MSELTSRAIKQLKRRERTPPTLRDAIVGPPLEEGGRPKELSADQLAGLDAEARLAANYAAELDEYARHKAAIAEAQKRADDELLRRVLSR